MTRDDFMNFFRDDEKLNLLSADDRVEVFRTILIGSVLRWVLLVSSLFTAGCSKHEKNRRNNELKMI